MQRISATDQHMLAFVRKIAYRLVRHLPSHIEVEDLISTGVLGWLDAKRKYNPCRVKSFEQYAEYRVRGAMLDYLRMLDHLGRDTRHTSKLHVNAVRVLAQRLGRAPDDAEVAAELGITIERYHAQRLHFTNYATSLDDPVENDDSWLFDHRTVQFDAEDRLLTALETTRLVQCYLSRLSDRHRRVIELYFFQDLNLRKIGELMGITESRSCQLVAEGLLLLRQIMEGKTQGQETFRQLRRRTSRRP